MTDAPQSISTGIAGASDGGPAQNTDRHLWPQTSKDAYAPSLFVTADGEGIGINVGGSVYVKTLREWHKLAGGPISILDAAQAAPEPKEITMQDVRLVCGEGKLEARHVLNAVNIIVKRRAEMAQPASNAYSAGNCGAWQPIATIPEAKAGETRRYLLWSTQLGLCIGSAGNLNDFVWANIAAYSGNAIEHWGVTHWRRELDGPALSSTQEKSPLTMSMFLNKDDLEAARKDGQE